MGMKSKRKGRTGEQELCRWLTSRGYLAERSQQYRGNVNSPDILCPDLPVAIECKRAEVLKAYQYIDKAQEDAGGKPAVVFYRKNRKRWIVLLDAEQFLNLSRKTLSD